MAAFFTFAGLEFRTVGRNGKRPSGGSFFSKMKGGRAPGLCARFNRGALDRCWSVARVVRHARGGPRVLDAGRLLGLAGLGLGRA